MFQRFRSYISFENEALFVAALAFLFCDQSSVAGYAACAVCPLWLTVPSPDTSKGPIPLSLRLLPPSS
jgi:hypothetical protein